MMPSTRTTASSETITVRVPMQFRRRSGRKALVVPDGAADVSKAQQIDNALIRAVARAFRWRRQIESGACSSIAKIAAAGRVSPSYVGRVLRLSLLAPDIIEATLDGRHGPAMTLTALMRPFPDKWETQQAAMGAPHYSINLSAAAPG
jgi:hypothetical protein